MFESNRGTKHQFTAETTLGPEFVSGWTGRKGKRLRTKIEATKQKIKMLANEIYDCYFKTAQSTPRGTVAKLAQIVEQIELACERSQHLSSVSGTPSAQWKEKLTNALHDLGELLREENSISAYELHTSGLIQVLLKMLAKNRQRKYSWNSTASEIVVSQRLELFKQELGDEQVAASLVRKLVAVLESTEKLPVYMYESPGSTSYGLQILTRRLRFRLERAPGETSLIDRTGRCLKAEPLTTVAQLERYLLKMIARQWYHYSRSTYAFVKLLREPQSKICFTHQRDFDTGTCDLICR